MRNADIGTDIAAAAAKADVMDWFCIERARWKRRKISFARTGRRDRVDNLLITLMGIALCLSTYALWEMVEKIKQLQALINLYRVEVWEHFSKKEE